MKSALTETGEALPIGWLPACLIVLAGAALRSRQQNCLAAVFAAKRPLAHGKLYLVATGGADQQRERQQIQQSPHGCDDAARGGVAAPEAPVTRTVIFRGPAETEKNDQNAASEPKI